MAAAFSAALATGGQALGQTTTVGARELQKTVAENPPLPIETREVKIGFLRSNDIAPLAVAEAQGFFAEEGLNVVLEVENDWGSLEEKVISGELTAAVMLAGQPLYDAVRRGAEDVSAQPAPIIVPMSVSLHGNAITVSNTVWRDLKPRLRTDSQRRATHPITADSLRPVIERYKAEGHPMLFGEVYPTSNHNYELRYWLAAGGVHPGYYNGDHTLGDLNGDVAVMVMPSHAMPSALKAFLIDGFVASEPWNSQAVVMRSGVPVIADREIWAHNPEKVLGVNAAFAEANPNATLAIVKAMIRGARWLDAEDHVNRPAAVELLRRPEYLGASAKVLEKSLLGSFEYERGDVREDPDFFVFFKNHANFPYYSDAIWFLTQMRRWGQIKQFKPDSWYIDVAKKIYREDVYLSAARHLVDEGLAEEGEFLWDSDGYHRDASGFIDGKTFDAHAPNAYIESFEIGLKGNQQVKHDQIVDAPMPGG